MIIKSELYKIFKSKKSITLIMFVMFMPILDVFINYYNSYSSFNKYYKGITEEFSSKFLLNPDYATFLAGSSPGHITQMILVWILPLYFLMIYSDFYVKEKKQGYNSIIFTKCSRKNIIYSKMIVSFLVPFCISIISLSINFILCHILFKGGTMFRGLEGMNINEFFNWSMKHTTIINCIYILVYSIIAGGCGVLCTAISFLFPNYKNLYALVFFIWILLNLFKYPTFNVIQPFIEYGLDYIIPAAIIYIVTILLATIISFKGKVKSDEV